MKEYIRYLEKRVEELCNFHEEEVKGIMEYCEENLEYSNGSDCESMIIQASSNLSRELYMLCCRADDKGVPEAELVRIFGEEIAYQVV